MMQQGSIGASVSNQQLNSDTSFDPFFRVRTSAPYTLLDSKQTDSNLPLIFDDVGEGVGTSSTWSKQRASTTIAVAANQISRRVRTTFRRLNYQPGKGMLVNITAVLNQARPGIYRRIGYFDTNNGLMFVQRPDAFGVNIRSSVSGSVVDTFIPQSEWNIDKMDGTGKSRILLDLTKSQIFVIDFEWLGVGCIRYGFVIGRQVYYCHIIENANLTAGVYMSTPNLPITYEIENDGTGSAASLETICSTVISEGGQELTGVDRVIRRGAPNGFVTATNGAIFPILSFRQKTTHIGTTIIPREIAISTTTTAAFEWFLLLNPTIGGSDAAVWQSLRHSAVEYDINRTNLNVITDSEANMIEIAGGHGTAATNISTASLPQQITLGSGYQGVRDQMVLAVRTFSPTPAETFFAKITFRELT